MSDLCTLKNKICILRKMVEDEYLLEDYDSEKLLYLSKELDKLIFEFFVYTGSEDTKL